jgi:hypothetical protein
MTDNRGKSIIAPIPYDHMSWLGQKGQRIGRNPKTGKEVPITPRRVLVFRPSNIMKDRINAGLARRRAAE